MCTTGHTLTILLHREVCGSSGGAFVCGINVCIIMCVSVVHKVTIRIQNARIDKLTPSLTT